MRRPRSKWDNDTTEALAGLLGLVFYVALVIYLRRTSRLRRIGFLAGRQAGLFAGRRAVEAEVHDRLLTPVRMVQRYLGSVVEQLPEHERARVLPAVNFLDAVLNRERTHRSARSEDVIQIVSSAYWLQKMFDADGRVAPLVIDPRLQELAQHRLPAFDADASWALTEIISEAIENSQRHSRGEISVNIALHSYGHGETCNVSVRDGGPVREPDRSGRGLANARRRSEEHGWQLAFVRGNDNEQSVFSLSMPLP